MNNQKLVLKKLEEYWRLMPDLRLGQLICNLVDLNNNTSIVKDGDNHIYYFEDEKMIKILEQELEKVYRLKNLSAVES